MSWASDAVKRLRPPHNEGSAWAIERAIRETIEEAAKRCGGTIGAPSAEAVESAVFWVQACKLRILTMLEDEP
jgi:hypothetical protein